MAQRLLTVLRRVPPPVRIALIYLAARVVTTGFLLLAAGMSGPTSRFGADATISDLVGGWDAQWYWFTAVHGYPADLPVTDEGRVAENQWAFMPVYAYLAAAVGAVFGSWLAGAVVVSLLAGYGACLVLYALLRPRLDVSTATWAVLFFSTGPLAALFQVGYAESLFVLLLFLALWCVQRRRYLWLYAIIPLLGYTRPGVLAFALFLGLFGIWRWVRRRHEPLRLSEGVHIVALGVLAVVVGFSWQVFAGLVTGRPDAYLQTELSWRRAWLPDSGEAFVPFDGFVRAAALWFERWGLGADAGYVALGVLVVALALALLFEPHVRRLGVEVRLWSASYLLYLVTVFFPQSSIFRLLLPLSPLWGALAAPRSPAWRTALLLAALLGQWWWIYNMYALGNMYWQIP